MPRSTVQLAYSSALNTPISEGPRSRSTRSRSRLVLISLLLSVFTVLSVLLTSSTASAHRPWGPWNGTCNYQCNSTDTVAKGQLWITLGLYEEAIDVFTCVIESDPTGIEGYRGRIEAEVLLNRYSDAIRDYAKVTADVMPVHPDVAEVIFAGYDARLAQHPWSVPALTGASFAHWWFYDHVNALPILQKLLTIRPFSVFGRLFRGSSRLFAADNVQGGLADMDLAILLAPTNPHVRFIVADAYTYAYPDPTRALAEATVALEGGLDTPRINAILASAYLAQGDDATAAFYFDEHITSVTTEIVSGGAFDVGDDLVLDLVPGRTYELAVTVSEGERVQIATTSPGGQVWDSILVVTDANGDPVVGADDVDAFWAALDWTAPAAGTYTLRVTSFESVGTGPLAISRQ